jgi:hypothetical protein
MIVRAQGMSRLLGLGEEVAEGAAENGQAATPPEGIEPSFFDRTFLVMGREIPQWLGLAAAGALLWMLMKD